MRCEDIKSRLKAYTRGEITPDDREAVAAHLRNCTECSRELARIDSLAALLAHAQTPPVPAGFASRLMAAARSRQLAKAAARWNPVQWWRQATMGMHAAAAAVLVVGLAVGLALGPTAMPQPSQGPAAQVAAQDDALDSYNMDYLGDTPAGSLAGSYLALVSGRNGEER